VARGATVLYGSQTGNGRRLGSGRGLEARLAAESRALPTSHPNTAHERVLLLVVSTHGDGDPPDDIRPLFRLPARAARAAARCSEVCRACARRFELPEVLCDGRALDDRLAELGARRLTARVRMRRGPGTGGRSVDRSRDPHRRAHTSAPTQRRGCRSDQPASSTSPRQRAMSRCRWKSSQSADQRAQCTQGRAPRGSSHCGGALRLRAGHAIALAENPPATVAQCWKRPSSTPSCRSDRRPYAAVGRLAREPPRGHAPFAGSDRADAERSRDATLRGWLEPAVSDCAWRCRNCRSRTFAAISRALGR